MCVHQCANGPPCKSTSVPTMGNDKPPHGKSTSVPMGNDFNNMPTCESASVPMGIDSNNKPTHESASM